MLRIEINEENANISDTNPSWVIDNIKKRQANGIVVCVKIFIRTKNINITLSCSDNPSTALGGHGGRSPNQEEQDILSAWRKFNCTQSPINPGHIVAFLSHIKSL